MSTPASKKEHREYMRQWRTKNLERAREIGRQSYQRRREDEEFRAARLAANRKWKAAHPERVREYALKNNGIGLTLEEYRELLRRQNGVCAICKRDDSRGSLAVDHCHKTGLVRGLLCRSCNTSLGKMNDDPELLRRAIAYLENDQ